MLLELGDYDSRPAIGPVCSRCLSAPGDSLCGQREVERRAREAGPRLTRAWVGRGTLLRQSGSASVRALKMASRPVRRPHG